MSYLVQLGGFYSIAGYDKIEEWAMLNDVNFRRTVMECRQQGFSEADTMRLIIAMLLMEKHKQIDIHDNGDQS